MATVYIRKDLYDEIVKRGEDVTEFANGVVEEALKKKKRRLNRK